MRARDRRDIHIRQDLVSSSSIWGKNHDRNDLWAKLLGRKLPSELVAETDVGDVFCSLGFGLWLGLWMELDDIGVESGILGA
jgi:hypothetical protein